MIMRKSFTRNNRAVDTDRKTATCVTNVHINNVIRLLKRSTKATDKNSGCDRRFRNSESDFQRKKISSMGTETTEETFARATRVMKKHADTILCTVSLIYRPCIS